MTYKVEKQPIADPSKVRINGKSPKRLTKKVQITRDKFESAIRAAIEKNDK